MWLLLTTSGSEDKVTEYPIEDGSAKDKVSWMLFFGIRREWPRQCTWTPEAWLRQVAAFLGFARVIKPVLSLPDHAGLVSQACELRCSTQLSPLTLQVLLTAGALRSLSRRDWVPHISSRRCYYVTRGMSSGPAATTSPASHGINSGAHNKFDGFRISDCLLFCFWFVYDWKAADIISAISIHEGIDIAWKMLKSYQLYQSMMGLILHERDLNYISYINPWRDWYCMKDT